ncbi:hypothetical protein [Kocuria aegyptia]|uniref:hypothetical protein n=1 Tax=Kocuria aegyptia TaxID=330943 RepID=UPI0031D590C7
MWLTLAEGPSTSERSFDEPVLALGEFASVFGAISVERRLVLIDSLAFEPRAER